MSNAYELIANLRNQNIIQSKKIFESLILEKCNELIENRKEELKNKIFNEEKTYISSYKVPSGPSGFNAHLFKLPNGNHVLSHPGHGNKIIETIKKDKDPHSVLKSKGYHRIPERK